jgi:hypothetical protein
MKAFEVASQAAAGRSGTTQPEPQQQQGQLQQQPPGGAVPAVQQQQQQQQQPQQQQQQPQQVDLTKDINSTTHKNEYARFKRGVKNPKSFPKELIPMTNGAGLNNLFKDWLECGQDFLQVKLKIERGSESSTSSLDKYSHIKARDMTYPDIKKAVIIKKCLEHGWWKWDPMLPGDEDERMYLVISEMSWEGKTKKFERSSMSGKANIDAEFATELATEGPFAPSDALAVRTAPPE